MIVFSVISCSEKKLQSAECMGKKGPAFDHLLDNLYNNYCCFGEQGFEFWLSHSLPVDHLENLLLKHMSKFFYPLGLLLFCKTGNNGEEEVETQKQAVSMLNHLSTRFCLQLCSNLLNHIDQSKSSFCRMKK